MATGRTLTEFQRLYMDGYDFSGYLFDSGEQGITYGEAPLGVWTDAVAGYLPTRPTVTFGPVNGVFDNTASTGLHVLAGSVGGVSRDVMLLQGVRAAPAFGDDAFCIPAWQTSYKMNETSGANTVTMTFAGVDPMTALLYDDFWGKCLHILTSESAANSANTNVDNGAQSLLGGWMMYHIYSITGAGTVTVSIDDSADGLNWNPLAGATSGAIATASAPTSGIVQLGVTATVRQYLRWQFAKGGAAASAIFALAFMRGR